MIDLIDYTLYIVETFTYNIKIYWNIFIWIYSKKIIDINILRNNIIQYITDKLNYNNNNLLILNDICFLITFMGNDFLPAIHSFKNKR